MNKLPKNTVTKLVAATSKASPKTSPLRVKNASELPVTQSVKTPLLTPSLTGKSLAASMSEKYTKSSINKGVFDAKSFVERPSIASQVAGLKVKSPGELFQYLLLAPKLQTTNSPKSILKKSSSCEVSFSPKGKVKKIHWGSEITFEVQAPLLTPEEQKLQQVFGQYKEELIQINDIIFNTKELNEKDSQELAELLSEVVKSIDSLSFLYENELRNPDFKKERLNLLINAYKMKVKLQFDSGYIALSNQIKKTNSCLSKMIYLNQMEKANEIYLMLELNVFDFLNFFKDDFGYLSKRQKTRIRRMGEKLELSIDKLLDRHKEEFKAQQLKYRRLIQPEQGEGLQSRLLKREMKISTENTKKLTALSELLKERTQAIKKGSHNE